MTPHGACTSGDLYVASSNSIYKFLPSGDKSTVASGIFQPVALAFDRSSNLYVANSGAAAPQSQPSTIIKITPDGTQSTFATINSDQLTDLAFDGAGNLFVAAGISILKITPAGAQSTFASPVRGLRRLVFDSLGYLYAAVRPFFGSNTILKFAPDGSSSTFTTFPAGSSVTALAFNTNGELFLEYGGSIWKVARDGSSSSVFAPGGNFYTGSLAFDTNGNLFVGEEAFGAGDPAIIKFTPAGTQSTFASGVLLPHGFAFEPVTEKLRNISARGFVGSGNNTLIGGFIVGGSALANNAMLIRALGPSLPAGVDNPLPNPRLELHDSSGALIAANDDWQSTQEQQITASGLAPADARESAIYATLAAGNYTAVVRSAQDGTSGTALIEVYGLGQ